MQASSRGLFKPGLRRAGKKAAAAAVDVVAGASFDFESDHTDEEVIPLGHAIRVSGNGPPPQVMLAVGNGDTDGVGAFVGVSVNSVANFATKTQVASGGIRTVKLIAGLTGINDPNGGKKIWVCPASSGADVGKFTTAKPATFPAFGGIITDASNYTVDETVQALIQPDQIIRPFEGGSEFLTGAGTLSVDVCHSEIINNSASDIHCTLPNGKYDQQPHTILYMGNTVPPGNVILHAHFRVGGVGGPPRDMGYMQLGSTYYVRNAADDGPAGVGGVASASLHWEDQYNAWVVETVSGGLATLGAGDESE